MNFSGSLDVGAHRTNVFFRLSAFCDRKARKFSLFVLCVIFLTNSDQNCTVSYLEARKEVKGKEVKAGLSKE